MPRVPILRQRAKTATAVQDLFAATYLPIEVRMARGAGSYELGKVSYGDLSLIESRSDRWSGMRTDAGLVVDAPTVVFVVHRGHVRVRQGAEVQDLRPGSIGAWDGTQAGTVDVREPLHKHAIVIPRTRLLPAELQRPIAFATEVSAGQRMLSGYLRQLAAELPGMTDAERLAAADVTIAMLRLALRSVQSPDPSASLRDSMYVPVVRWIDRHLREPDLTPTRIAAAHGISLRTLQAAFAHQGATVAGHVRVQRLHAARRDLELGPEQAVGEVAERYGFRTAAHFTTAFGHEHGITPGEARRSRRRDSR